MTLQAEIQDILDRGLKGYIGLKGYVRLGRRGTLSRSKGMELMHDEAGSACRR